LNAIWRQLFWQIGLEAAAIKPNNQPTLESIFSLVIFNCPSQLVQAGERSLFTEKSMIYWPHFFCHKIGIYIGAKLLQIEIFGLFKNLKWKTWTSQVLFPSRRRTLVNVEHKLHPQSNKHPCSA
jgi:hypothetical protein